MRIAQFPSTWTQGGGDNPRRYRKERTRLLEGGWRSAVKDPKCPARIWQRPLLGDVPVGNYERSSGGFMGQRTFADSDGTSWNVTAIQPQLTERRLSDRRAASNSIVDFRAERRREPDRRHVREVRAPVREGFERGWLVFDNGNEKRRLAPIPASWEQMTTHELRTLCARAARTLQRWTRLVE
jgi:hypothetical protein